jgi:hypothetical protein
MYATGCPRWERTTPMLTSHASVSITNFSLKSRRAKTGADMSAFFKAWKAVSVSGVQMNTMPFFSNAVNGLLRIA